MSEEYEADRLPGNPRLNETVHQFLTRQRKFVGRTKWPEGTTFDCKQCGDCCRWNFIVLTSGPETIKGFREQTKFPHGNWLLTPKGKLRLVMPEVYTFLPRREYSSTGVCPPKQVDFLRGTGRTWGYWVMNDRDQIIIYSPTPCIHLQEDNSCGIYESRPEACEPYFCKRYPILPEETKNVEI